MGLFSFSQYVLLNESQRLRLQRARSHRCHRQPPDSACAHGDPPRPLDATDSRRAAPARKAPSLALRIVLNHLGGTEANFRPVLHLFCFYEAILRDKTNFQRLDRRNNVKSRKRRIAATEPPSKGTDRYNLKRAPFVSMMCIRAVVRPVLLPMVPRTDARCSRR